MSTTPHKNNTPTPAPTPTAHTNTTPKPNIAVLDVEKETDYQKSLRYTVKALISKK